jgi:hypothetical protein
MTLEKGNLNESVEIKGTSPMTQSDKAEISTALGTRLVRELPIIDRNYQQMIGLQSGITYPVPILDFRSIRNIIASTARTGSLLFGLFKTFRFMDRFNLQVRGEAYNLANSTHPVNPVTNINSPAFGQITSATPTGAIGAFGRQVNLGARVEF